MKKSLILLIGVALSSGACTAYVAGPAVPARGYYGPTVGVVVADRSYYTHGQSYYSRGGRYVWVGGHYANRRNGRVWIHGRYVAR